MIIRNIILLLNKNYGRVNHVKLTDHDNKITEILVHKNIDYINILKV